MKLHIYGQTYNHDHAFIVGNKEALESLRDAIQAALDGKTTECVAFAADGEGYEVKVYQEDSDVYWDNASLPYTDSETLGINSGPDSIGPWELFARRKSK